MRSRMIVAALVLAAAVGLAVGNAPAGACSFALAQLVPPESVTAGGAFTVAGTGFFRIEGEVEADCSGDYEQIALTDVTMTATFTTPSGPVEVEQPVTVREDASFTIEPVAFDVPAGTTAVNVRTDAFEGDQGVDIPVEPAAAPAPPPTAPPADPVPTDADFTG